MGAFRLGRRIRYAALGLDRSLVDYRESNDCQEGIRACQIS